MLRILNRIQMGGNWENSLFFTEAPGAGESRPAFGKRWRLPNKIAQVQNRFNPLWSQMFTKSHHHSAPPKWPAGNNQPLPCYH